MSADIKGGRPSKGAVLRVRLNAIEPNSSRFETQVLAMEGGILVSRRRAISPAAVPGAAESSALKKRFRFRVSYSRLSVLGTFFFGVVGATAGGLVDEVVFFSDFGWKCGPCAVNSRQPVKDTID